MKVEFEVNVHALDPGPVKTGQISVKVSKEHELKYKELNIKHSKKLSVIMRHFALALMQTVDLNGEELSLQSTDLYKITIS